jgi:hypothetical protein
MPTRAGRASQRQRGRTALGQPGADASPTLGLESADIEDLPIRRSDRIARTASGSTRRVVARAFSVSAA